MNRYTSLSTGSFKPLDLQTIMMIPMAKQKMHDEAQSAANEYAALQASSLEQDREAVTERLESLRGDANKITATLLDRGVDRNTMAQLNELKRKKEKEFGQQGFIGAAQANYNTASAFVKDLAEKKERQAGWGAGKAKQWAQGQVAAFKGTDAGNGKFNSFSGKELDQFVDGNKWINENLPTIAEDVIRTGLTKDKNVSSFIAAWKDGLIEEKSMNKIIKSLGMRAQYDTALQDSLKQSGAFNPLDKDPTNIGSFEIKNINGVPTEVFVPKSFFGAQLAGAAKGASYRKDKSTIDYVKDDYAMNVALDLRKRGLDEKTANDLVAAVNFKLMNIETASYESLTSAAGLAKEESDITSMKLANLGKILKEGKKDANGKYIVPPVDPLTDRNYQTMVSENNAAKIKYTNLIGNLNNLQEKAGAGRSLMQRRRATEGAAIDDKIDNMFKNAPSFGEKVRGLLGGELVQRDYRAAQEKKLGLTDSQRTKLSMMIMPNESAYKFEVKKLVMLNKGLLFPKNGNVNQAYGDYLNENKEFSKKVKAYMKDNPAAYDGEVLHGEATGKYASITGRSEALLTDAFKKSGGLGWFDGETGADIRNQVAQAREDYPKSIVAVSPTTRISSAGQPIEAIQIRDEFGNNIKTFMATRGSEGRDIQQMTARSLMNSNQFAEMGARTLKRSMYPEVFSMNIHQPGFKRGVVPGIESLSGNLFFLEKYDHSDSFLVKEIDKDKYLKSNAKDIVKIGEGDGNVAADADEITNIIYAKRKGQ